MDKEINKYRGKLVTSGLCEKDAPLFGTLDDELQWNSSAPEREVLDTVIRSLGVMSILYSSVKEPYRSMIDMLGYTALSGKCFIQPDDTETRTFLHDIPVVETMDAGKIVSALKKRKGVIIPGHGIVTYGTFTPEQAFVTFSSICYCCYVKFMTDYYYYSRGMLSMESASSGIVEKALGNYSNSLSSINFAPKLTAPFRTDEDIISAMAEAGRLTVQSGMVDSFFGNISARKNGLIFISQTGSSLDELEGHIDPCPMNNSTTNAITSSSEFSAHRGIYSSTDRNTILHGHPKYSVIMSLICDRYDCLNRGKCHINCQAGRMIGDIPVIPGEIGTGVTGLSETLPRAMKGRGAIVYGHGLFTSGKEDFTDAFNSLIDIEKSCFKLFTASLER